MSLHASVLVSESQVGDIFGLHERTVYAAGSNYALLCLPIFVEGEIEG